MPSLQQSLLALQQAETDLETCRQRVRALHTELARDAALADARTAADTTGVELTAAQHDLRDGEQTLERLGRTISLLEKRLYDGSIHNAKELAGVEEELRHRRGERGAAEDHVLAAMERLEAAQAAATSARARLSRAEEAHRQRVPALKAEGRAVLARAEGLQERRGALAAATPPALLARYERLRGVSRPAVVAIVDGNCGGCGVAVPTALRQRAAADEVVQCLNCDRILVGTS